jgi:hypothetical protein
VREVLDVLGEAGNAIGFREYDVHRELDAELLRELTEPVAECTCGHRTGIAAARGRERLTAITDDCHARRLLPARQGALEPRRLQSPHEPAPSRWIIGDVAARLDEERVASEPEIDATRGKNGIIAEYVAGEQLDIDAGTHD